MSVQWIPVARRSPWRDEVSGPQSFLARRRCSIRACRAVCRARADANQRGVDVDRGRAIQAARRRTPIPGSAAPSMADARASDGRQTESRLVGAYRECVRRSRPTPHAAFQTLTPPYQSTRKTRFRPPAQAPRASTSHLPLALTLRSEVSIECDSSCHKVVQRSCSVKRRTRIRRTQSSTEKDRSLRTQCAGNYSLDSQTTRVSPQPTTASNASRAAFDSDLSPCYRSSARCGCRCGRPQKPMRRRPGPRRRPHSVR